MDEGERLFREGFVLQQAGQAEAALARYDAVLALTPDHALSYCNRGLALWTLGRQADAMAEMTAALAAQPPLFLAHHSLGVMLASQGRAVEALTCFEAAMALSPHSAEALIGRGNALIALGRDEEALETFDRALRLKPDISAFNNRGGVLLRLKRHREALDNFEAALARAPDHANAALNRVITLQALGREDEAIIACEERLARNPDDEAFAVRLFCLAHAVCDWPRLKKLEPRICDSVRAGKALVEPFEILGVFDDPALQLRCAQNRVAALPLPPPLQNVGSYSHDRIRVAYLSADFSEHATALLAARLFELHDRTRFEIIAIDFSEEQASPMRARLKAAFDQFHSVRTMSAADTARLIATLEVDIAVDLKGHTAHSRPQILSYRPAPVQASWLGYPGSMGADFIDYVIADKVVAPFGHQPFFTEKIVHLPHSYQVNDDTRPLPSLPARQEAGLPEHGFVFGCFNNHWKITQEMFDLWLRLLVALPDSVLWLLEGPGRRNLERAAAARGIDPARLVFAPRVGLEPHLNRLGLTDLMLDTLPCNAHTTASDALWAGVPLITCAGASFAARVAASLLQAVGLDELVVTNLPDYQDMALGLARDPAALAVLRTRLAASRTQAPLFDSFGFTRDLEQAFEIMHRRAVRGEAPEPFAIAATA